MKTTSLLYHDVIPPGRFDLSGFQSPDANIYKLETGEFSRHLAEVERRMRTRPRLVTEAEDGSLLITFDDGGKSATSIAEQLEAHGWRGHFFVTGDYIGTPGFLDAAEIRDLTRRGHIIGSHSCSHPLRMAALSDTQLDFEWRESIRRLEEILGGRVDTASIPGGLYGDNVARAAARAGVRYLFTSEPVRSVKTIDGCRIFGRFSVQQGVSADWVGAVVAGELWPRLQRKLFWDAKKVLKKAGGEVWLQARRAILARGGRTRNSTG
jgi:peptidoglycan/xylan/chitin deacetylase (PgdA/CDA1 family)